MNGIDDHPIDDDHYQPWLNRDDSSRLTRPAPLPTRRASGDQPDHDAVLAPHSVDDLLARPLPTPSPDHTPRSALSLIASSWDGLVTLTADVAARIDAPRRLAALEIPQRTRMVGRNGARAAGRFGSAVNDRLHIALPHVKSGLGAVAGALGQVGQGVARELRAGAAGITNRARTLASPSTAVIESQLDKLVGEETVTTNRIAATTAPGDTNEPVTPPSKLPLFGAQSAGLSREAQSQSREATGGIAARTTAVGYPSTVKPWHRQPATLALAAVALLSAGFAVGQHWSAPSVNRASTEVVIHDYLLNHPEILPQAMERLQDSRTTAAISRVGTRLRQPFSGAWAGAADGDVTLVMFADYACTYCRASLPAIDRLLREDPRLKIVFRELPILSRDSEAAARLALVAARHGQYMAMHRRLFASNPPDATARRASAIALDVANDDSQLRDPAITRELQSNVDMARALGFNGTPSWVIGTRILSGAVGYEALRDAIAQARRG